MRAEEEAELANTRLKNLAPIAVNVLALLMGTVLLGLWRSSGSRELLLSSGLLLSGPLGPLINEVVAAAPLVLTQREFFSILAPVGVATEVMVIAFIRGMFSLKDIWFSRLAVPSVLISNSCLLIVDTADEPSPIVAASLKLALVGFALFDSLIVAACLWEIFVKRQNRVVAATLALPFLVFLLSMFRFVHEYEGVTPFIISGFISIVGLSVALGWRAWKEWRSREALKAEFEAAHEMQQRLVTPAGDLPGFKVESAYLPATHVGGDFFYIRPENQGGLLVVVGDVSGKGLRAALTVSAIMGALRTMPSQPPKQILGDLNRALAGQMHGGFVTCCAIRIGPNGTLTAANAGHLSPYRDGKELTVEAGLPLGIDAGIQYGECQASLGPAEALTFVSDGVVEARKPTGELFGFERTREISGSSATTIAAAAQAFGQDDDITVVQLRRVPPVTAPP